MAVVSNVSGILSLTASFTEVVSSGVVAPSSGGGSLSLQSIISIADQLTNSTGAAKTCDLMYAKQLTAAAAPTLIDFSSLTDPGGTSQNWTSGPGRVRLLIIQNVDTTPGHDLSVYKDATSGVLWLPASTGPNKVYANGCILVLYDPNSNGSTVGQIVSSSAKRLDVDPGANTVTFNVIAIGDSVQ